MINLLPIVNDREITCDRACTLCMRCASGIGAADMCFVLMNEQCFAKRPSDPTRVSDVCNAGHTFYMLKYQHFV